MGVLIPAVLPTSREDLEEKIALFARMEHVSRVQIDTVDGRFASPANWPYTNPREFRSLIAEGMFLPRLNRFEYEIDLMSLDAEQAGSLWLSLGATRLTFHAEAATDLPRMFSRMHARHTGGAGFAPRLVAFGVALNIASDIALVERVLHQVEYVQFMGIGRIGKQGQPFDRRVIERVRAFHRRHPDIAVQVDGGVNVPEARELMAAGATNVVVGSDILRAADPVAEARRYETLGGAYGV